MGLMCVEPSPPIIGTTLQQDDGRHRTFRGLSAVSATYARKRTRQNHDAALHCAREAVAFSSSLWQIL
eukprot:11360-Heterococcus_DN1.PRE.3